MSQENVENLRAYIETLSLGALNRGEFDLWLLDPEVTYEDTVLPDSIGEAYRAPEGVARATERWAESYEELRVELERIVGAGNHLVSIHRARTRARYTGIEEDLRYAYLWTFRNGRVIHFRSYRDPAESLEAVGLSE
jgi:ketosteroid isomerase-like protein